MEVKISDIKLMEQIKAGDEKAFRSLFDCYFTPLTLFAERFTNDNEAAIDIVQTLFVSLYENRNSLNIRNVKSFLYQSVKNRCINEIKRRKYTETSIDDILSVDNEAEDDIEDAIAYSELKAQLAQALSTLQPQCQKIFELSRFDGFSNDEIADQLNLSKRTVETQISKALKQLRSLLGDLFASILILCGFYF
ncbi:MAG: RNA polymerase sigma-70 factor [Bacteroidales bacterium]|nr:RNA polymerase sigma-70 factor [Bacteroidales bacterium]